MERDTSAGCERSLQAGVRRREKFSVEVVEHLYGESVYRDMLENKGEGIHML